jgi:hypothetical protein
LVNGSTSLPLLNKVEGVVKLGNVGYLGGEKKLNFLDFLLAGIFSDEENIKQPNQGG